MTQPTQFTTPEAQEKRKAALREAWKRRKERAREQTPTTREASYEEKRSGLSVEDVTKIVTAAVAAALADRQGPALTIEELEGAARSLRQKAQSFQNDEMVTMTPAEIRAVQANRAAISNLPAEIAGDGSQRPGTRIPVGKDRFGEIVKAAIVWRREDIEGRLECTMRHEPPLTPAGHGRDCYQPYVWSYRWVAVVPPATMPVAPHGIRYHVEAEKEVLLPSIVWDVYQDTRRNDMARGRANPPLSAEEDRRVSNAAIDGGLGISRVHRVGFGGLPPEPVEEAMT